MRSETGTEESSEYYKIGRSGSVALRGDQQLQAIQRQCTNIDDLNLTPRPSFNFSNRNHKNTGQWEFNKVPNEVIRMMATDHFMSLSSPSAVNNYDDPTHTVELTALSKSAEAEAYESPPLEPPPNYDELDSIPSKPSNGVTE